MLESIYAEVVKWQTQLTQNQSLHGVSVQVRSSVPIIKMEDVKKMLNKIKKVVRNALDKFFVAVLWDN